MSRIDKNTQELGNCEAELDGSSAKLSRFFRFAHLRRNDPPLLPGLRKFKSPTRREDIWREFSGEDVSDHAAGLDTCEKLIEALKLEGETLVINAHECRIVALRSLMCTGLSMTLKLNSSVSLYTVPPLTPPPASHMQKLRG
jgi:hypothetical protein